MVERHPFVVHPGPCPAVLSFAFAAGTECLVTAGLHPARGLHVGLAALVALIVAGLGVLHVAARLAGVPVVGRWPGSVVTLMLATAALAPALLHAARFGPPKVGHVGPMFGALVGALLIAVIAGASPMPCASVVDGTRARGRLRGAAAAIASIALVVAAALALGLALFVSAAWLWILGDNWVMSWLMALLFGVPKLAATALLARLIWDVLTRAPDTPSLPVPSLTRRRLRFGIPLATMLAIAVAGAALESWFVGGCRQGACVVAFRSMRSLYQHLELPRIEGRPIPIALEPVAAAEVFPEVRDLRDGWGRPLLYWSDGRSFEIRSLGAHHELDPPRPDGWVAAFEDDLVVRDGTWRRVRPGGNGWPPLQEPWIGWRTRPWHVPAARPAAP